MGWTNMMVAMMAPVTRSWHMRMAYTFWRKALRTALSEKPENWSVSCFCLASSSGDLQPPSTDTTRPSLSTVKLSS